MEDNKHYVLLVIALAIVGCYMFCKCENQKDGFASYPGGVMKSPSGGYTSSNYSAMMNMPSNMGSGQYNYPRTGDHWQNNPQPDRFPFLTAQCNGGRGL